MCRTLPCPKLWQQVFQSVLILCRQDDHRLFRRLLLLPKIRTEHCPNHFELVRCAPRLALARVRHHDEIRTPQLDPPLLTCEADIWDRQKADDQHYETYAAK